MANVKQPVGHSGGAVCADEKLWAVSACHYVDPNTVRGCAVAIHQFGGWLKRLLPHAVDLDDTAEIAIGPHATPAQKALAKVLGKPCAWADLSRGFIAAMEKQIGQLPGNAAFSLPSLQSLDDIGVNPGVDPKLLLYRVSPAVTGVSGSQKDALKHLTETLRETILTFCNVLAERYVLGAALGGGRASMHDAHVPVSSEALAVVCSCVGAWRARRAP